MPPHQDESEYTRKEETMKLGNKDYWLFALMVILVAGLALIIPWSGDDIVDNHACVNSCREDILKVDSFCYNIVGNRIASVYRECLLHNLGFNESMMGEEVFPANKGKVCVDPDRFMRGFLRYNETAWEFAERCGEQDEMFVIKRDDSASRYGCLKEGEMIHWGGGRLP